MNLRVSRLGLEWDDILSGEQIWEWVYLWNKFELPKVPGVYRWMFPALDLGKPTAYVGETEVLSDRLAEYICEAHKQIPNLEKSSVASDSNSTEEELRFALKENHSIATIRIGAELMRKCESRAVKLQRLRIEEEESILGIEVSARLVNDKIGRVFFEHWAILKTEMDGYRMLNRDPSIVSKMLRKNVPASLGGRWPVQKITKNRCAPFIHHEKRRSFDCAQDG